MSKLILSAPLFIAMEEEKGKKIEHVWIVKQTPLIEAYPFEFTSVTTWEEIDPEACFAIILGQNNIPLLKTLRNQSAFRFTPIFCQGEVNEKELALFDGYADRHIISKARAIHKRLATVSTECQDNVNADIILLTYLLSRPDLVIRGELNYQLKTIYYYPLLDCLFSNEALDGWRFLQNLVMRDLLTTGPAFTEIQMCRHCNSGLLNFKHCCPNCYAITLERQKFVPCFSCGKMGLMSHFLAHNKQNCSYCHLPLKQSGIDKEIPLENYKCKACEHYFSTPLQSFICLVCERISLGSEFYCRALYDYQLSKRGEYFIQGVEKDIYGDFQAVLSLMDFNQFMALIAWQAKLSKRYNSLYFSVFGFQIDEIQQEIDKEQQEKQVTALWIQLFNELREVFRDSDLSSRMNDTLLFFLPMTGKECAGTLVNRIHQFVQGFAEKHKNPNLVLGFSYLSSQEIIGNQLEGELILMELQARMEKLPLMVR